MWQPTEQPPSLQWPSTWERSGIRKCFASAKYSFGCLFRPTSTSDPLLWFCVWGFAWAEWDQQGQNVSANVIMTMKIIINNSNNNDPFVNWKYASWWKQSFFSIWSQSITLECPRSSCRFIYGLFQVKRYQKETFFPLKLSGHTVFPRGSCVWIKPLHQTLYKSRLLPPPCQPAGIAEGGIVISCLF